MTLFFLDPMKKNRKEVQKVVDPSTPLRIKDGWFLTLNDRANDVSGVHHVCLRRTTVQFFVEKFPKVYQDMLDFFRLSSEHFPDDNWWKLRHAIDIAYLFAIAHYIHESDTKVTQIRRFFEKKRPPYKRLIAAMHPHFAEHLTGFYALASSRGVRISLFTLYKLAKEIITTKCPRSRLPNNLVQYYASDTLASPFTRHFLSSELEDELEERFMKSLSLRDIVYEAEADITGERCVVIALDMDSRIMKGIKNQTHPGVKVPDVIVVTRNFLFAIDIKVNISHAKREQVSAVNLREILKICWPEIGYIFQDVTIEGFNPPK